MDNRSIFLCSAGGAKGGRVREGQPLSGLRCQAREVKKGPGKAGSGAERVKAEPKSQK
jgi:hypothetical protein